ncbi:D-glycero-beta-D-manno-heptose-7-phosphate kinase [Leptospira sp. GIMC2001]|uniref:D-glycero-beta-D-manno-heptose-7-phosphate kinase n=1 Tax=Leptospira sp. GIMC2001 TaxID=1513297 RepID=UPI00234BA34F|nr:D-glycero-beta-D-manno-heptose-7-phosphate kinase [Leptospira sp. GIMC2001]WCL47904.1 D-glycero-beta-D-manno-heptose-7-phosphate kinase [Leptospira sp. GIMC2001]
MNREKFETATEHLKTTKILVVGDFILDEYLFGQVSRISPEAPVPVVWVRNEQTTLGGAGNVVKNLHCLGNPIALIGRCGVDEKGKLLIRLLEEESVHTNDIILSRSESIPTILKTRILAGHQQVCRVDREEVVALTTQEENYLFEQFCTKISECSAVILSDYDKGLLSGEFISKLVDECTKQNKIVTVDPQVSHFFRYQNVSILTPNHHEAGKALGRSLETTKDVEEACLDIYKKINPKAVMITRGEKGMTIFQAHDQSIHHIQTVAREVFDVTGAGDTVISVYTAFHAAGLNPVEASIVANAAAGVVVAKLGAATASIDEIRTKLQELSVWDE